MREGVRGGGREGGREGEEGREGWRERESLIDLQYSVVKTWESMHLAVGIQTLNPKP